MKASVNTINRGTIISASILSVCFVSLSLGLAFFAYEAKKHKVENKELENQVQMVSEYLNRMEDSMVNMQNYRSNIEDLARTPLQDEGSSDAVLEDSIGRFIHTYKERVSLEDKSRPVAQRLATLKDSTAHMESTLRILTTVLGHSKDFLEAIPSITPADGWVTSHYGSRNSPFTGNKVNHKGIDIGAREGTPVHATADGRVKFAGYSPTYGNIVIIEHAFNVQTRYAHNSKLLVRKGQKIKRGHKISLVGNTGRSTGAHLHYEVWVNNIPVDPMDYLIDKVQSVTIASNLSLAQSQMGGEEEEESAISGIADDHSEAEVNEFDATVAQVEQTESVMGLSSEPNPSSMAATTNWKRLAGIAFLSLGLMVLAFMFLALMTMRARSVAANA